MAKIFAILGVLLIVTGVVLLAAPKPTVSPMPPAPASRSASPERSAGPNSVGIGAREVPSLLTKARDIAEQVNAPLSILFGLMSLFYTRRTYLARRGGPPPGASSS